MSSHRPGPLAVGTALVVVGLGLGSLALDGPPPPRPADAPADTFSAARAMRIVDAIAQRPHPLGSADHDRVRDLVLAEIAHLGLTAERQATVALRSSDRPVAGRVENLMTRVHGTGPDRTGAILLATHYDSAPVSPGAADDGSGVAVVLETLRALKAGPPLRRDVIAVFTDAEENGLLGAAAFVAEHPWAKDVAVALNFEARGTRGPALMFETGPGNGVVVGAWAATPRPAGSSLAREIYKRLPNDTDFTIFRGAGMQGLNFAFIDNWKAYHSPLDSPANLDPGSVQQEGDAALALARRFGAGDASSLRGSDQVFFSIPWPHVAVVYPETWALPFALAAAVFWLVAAWLARGRRQAGILGIIVGVVLVGAFGAAAIFAGLRAADAFAWVQSRWLTPGSVLLSGAYAVALVLGIVTAWLAGYAVLRRWFAPRTLALSAALVGVAAAIASARLVPGGSYVFLWPLLAAIAAVNLIPPDGADGLSRAGRSVAIWLLSLPAALMLWPLASMIFTSVGLSATGGAAIAVLAVFGLFVLVPQLELAADGRRLWPAGLALLATLLAFVYGAATTGDSPDRPRAESVSYAMDADTGSASWVARAGAGDPWLAQYVGTAPGQGRPAWMSPPWTAAGVSAGFIQAPAPKTDVAAPSIDLIETAPVATGRSIVVRIGPAAAGHALWIRTTGPRVSQAFVDGRDVGAAPPDREWWSLIFANAPSGGIALALRVEGTAPLRLSVVDTVTGLPPVPGASFQPRPPWIMPDMRGDQTVVHRAATF